MGDGISLSSIHSFPITRHLFLPHLLPGFPQDGVAVSFLVSPNSEGGVQSYLEKPGEVQYSTTWFLNG